MEQKKEYRVYKVTNLRNERIYIGQTSRNIFTRLMSHGSDKNSPLYKDMQEQEFKDFNIIVIDIFDTRMKASWSEKKHILSHRSFAPEIGYNVMIGHNHSEETKKKIKDTSKKIGRTPEQLMSIQLMGLSRKGTKASEETIKKLSESHMGQIPWNKDKKLSLQHKKNLSLAKKGKILTESHKLAIKEAHLKRRKEM